MIIAIEVNKKKYDIFIQEESILNQTVFTGQLIPKTKKHIGKSIKEVIDKIKKEIRKKNS